MPLLHESLGSWNRPRSVIERQSINGERTDLARRFEGTLPFTLATRLGLF